MQVVTTVFFNGQFWIALIEKLDSSGTVFIGKYTFGPEPTNPQLLQFYLNEYSHVTCYQDTPDNVRVSRSGKSGKSPGRSSALDQWKIMHQAELFRRKQNSRKRQELDERERFALRQEKKKRKKRGR